MKVALDSGAAVLRLDFPTAEALRSFAGNWLSREGCLVRLAEPLELWTELTVELSQEGARRAAVEARVMQVFGRDEGGFATALQAIETGPLEASAAGAAKTADGGSGHRAGEPTAAGGTAKRRGPAPGAPASAGGGGEMLGSSPAFRIREMNVSEKIRHASRASRGERQILLRDGSPQVLMGLLANPRLEDKEVLALAKSTAASGGVLQRIGKDRRWTMNYEIRLALVKNPQTPTPLALKLLETLREPDLRVLAKGSMVREAIRGAALRKVIKR